MHVGTLHAACAWVCDSSFVLCCAVLCCAVLQPHVCDHSAGQGNKGSPNRSGAGTSPDDLVASLRRLRPHVHAAGPFDATSRSDFLAQSVVSKAQAAPEHMNTRSRPSADNDTAKAVSGHAQAVERSAGCASGGTMAEQGAARLLNVSTTISNDTTVEPVLGSEAQPSCPSDSDQASSSSTTVFSTDETARMQSSMDGQPSCQSGYSPTQLHALSIACSTVACLEIPRPSSCMTQQVNDHMTAPSDPAFRSCSETATSATTDNQQTAQQSSFDESTSVLRDLTQQTLISPNADSELVGHQQVTTSSHWLVQVKWAVPIVAAQHLSAAEGAVAVACADGMLLLLDMANGRLIRYLLFPEPNGSVNILSLCTAQQVQRDSEYCLLLGGFSTCYLKPVLSL